MSSNLYKAGWVVVQQDEKRVIDNNSRLEEKLSAVINTMPVAYEEENYGEEEGFTDGLFAQQVDALLAPEGGETVIKGEAAREREELLLEIEAAKEELAQLRMQADSMIADAKSEIGAMQMKAYEEAKNQGYQEGERLGREGAEAAKAQYLQKKKELEQEYQRKCDEIEPEFIDAITGIYEHIFKVDLSRYKGIVVNLLENVLQKTEGNRNFMIHVSKVDYENVMASRDRLRAEAGGGTSLEIIEDITLKKTQCYIETESGIFDCGLDTQLNELGRKLKLLSYEK